MILNNESLAFYLLDCMNQNKRVVFTNGCFDLIHQGHKDLLKKAKSFGDILLVGLNSDRSVKRLKGIKRPIQNEMERAKNLCEFGSVDRVIIFYEDTPARLIADIKPDVLVKGGDYTIESIIGAGDVLASGGRVEIVPLTPGYSTTRNLEKMNR
jgi:D-beta-D-heptose 7-phosphate kinase/D-beta-D-heptose 1-phosphate adenosyltransferase